MSEIKSRADLFEAAAKMMRMCDEAGVKWASKMDGELSDTWTFSGKLELYEFPLAIVEGKPVFKGDELYCTSPNCFQCRKNGTSKFIVGDEESGGVDPDFNESSWLPPKPRTVMVKLLREDAKFFSDAYCSSGVGLVHNNIAEACRKALEEK